MSKLRRDSTFWTIAGQATILNFFLGGFGPAQPLLREEQGTSLTVAGLHGTMMGIGAIIAGSLQAGMVHRFGRKNSAWIGLLIFTTGLPLFAFGPNVAATLFATFYMSIGFSTVINNMVTLLSHHYPNSPDVAVSQSNAINSVGYLLGTVFVGSLAYFGITWRLGLLLCIPAAIAIYLFGKDKIIDAHDHDLIKQSGKLSSAYWIAWFGFFAIISTEFSTTFWAAALVSERTGVKAAISILCITALGTGFALGRWYSPILLKDLTLDQRIKFILVLQMISFLIFWQSHNLFLSLISLFSIGLGISSQFSMSAVRLIRLSDGRPDLAIGKSGFAAGAAIALAPFFLAFLGDHIGISRAYLMVPVLIAIAYLALILVSSEESR